MMNELAYLGGLGVDKAEQLMLQHPQAECPVIHRYGPGVYIRELHMKAGTFAIGHRQKKDHINLLLQGAVLMVNEDGSTKELRAPLFFIGPPGRKIGYVLEDMVWQNIYATTETDVNKLEDMFLDKSPYWVALSAPLRRDRFNGALDRASFFSSVKALGFTTEDVSAMSKNTEDQTSMPQGSWKFKLDKSSIHGTGVFATFDILPGETIGPARIGDFRTPLGRYTNHGHKPNARMVRHGNDIVLMATHFISGCKGSKNGDEVTIDYKQSVSVVIGE